VENCGLGFAGQSVRFFVQSRENKIFFSTSQPMSTKMFASFSTSEYSFLNTPAMPLAVRGYAHFGGFFIARRVRA
jgi:hypothetical protein